MEKDLWSCLLVGVKFWCEIPEWRHMSCVNHVTGKIRTCVTCLETMDDICGLEESDKQQLVQIMVAGEDFAGLIGISEIINKKTFKNEDLVGATKNKLSVLSLYKSESLFKYAGPACRACYMTCTDRPHLKLYTIPILV